MAQTVLVCDDEKEIVEAVSIYLEGEGYRVLKAYDGLEALDLLSREHADLIIMDVMMPGMDGIHATLKIRETSSVPIIILSAKSEDTDKILGLNIGADNTAAVHIRHIREKIEINPKEPRYLKVVWGVGYKIEKQN